MSDEAPVYVTARGLEATQVAIRRAGALVEFERRHIPATAPGAATPVVNGAVLRVAREELQRALYLLNQELRLPHA